MRTRAKTTRKREREEKVLAGEVDASVVGGRGRLDTVPYRHVVRLGESSKGVWRGPGMKYKGKPSRARVWLPISTLYFESTRNMLHAWLAPETR